MTRKNLSDNLNAWIYVKYMNGNVSINYRCMYLKKIMISHYRQRNVENIIPNLEINNHIIEHVNEFNFLVNL